MTTFTYRPRTLRFSSRWVARITGFVLAVVLIVGGVEAGANASTSTRHDSSADSGCDQGAYGALLLSGSGWLGGNGVSVYSNCNVDTTGPYHYTSSGVLIGMEWQCVELVNRLYLTRGWTHATWYGNGSQLYGDAPSNLKKQPQGQISTLGPGDVVSYSSDADSAGHVAIVNSVTPNGSGGFTVGLINQNAPLRTTTTLQNGNLSAPWSGYAVIGVVHAPTTTPANGSFVSYNGNVYRIAGGAPLYVSSWSIFGGPQPTQALTQSQFDALAKYPANGTEVAVANPQFHGEGYVFAGGAPLSVSAWTNVNSNPQWTMVDGNALSHFTTTEPYDHVLQYPANGTDVAIGNSNDHGAGFVFAGGAPLAVAAWSNLPNPKVTFVDGNALDTYSSNDTWHALDHVRQYPANGTAVAVGNPTDHGAGYIFAGGAPLNVAGWSNVGNPQWVVVDSYALDNYSSTGPYHSLDHVRDYPANGTFLHTNTGSTYRTAGGAALAITNCTTIGGCPAPAPTDAWIITNAGQTGTHLRAAPTNGTTVEGLPSHHYWKFQNGKRTHTTATTSAIKVDDTSLTPYPIA